ncbi:MAG: hypothetical protein AAF288_06135 [Planctomycetota bacterium]
MTETPSPAVQDKQDPGPSTPAAAPEGAVVSGAVESCGLEHLVLKLPGTNYRLKLAWSGAALAERARVSGVITARARRIDVVPAGGRFVEPVFGRPRRVQGRVIAVDADANVVWVKAGPALCVTPTDPRQKASDFAVGALISFDVEAGARLTPMGG